MSAKRIIFATIIIWIVVTFIRALTCGWLFVWVYQIPPDIWIEPIEMVKADRLIGSNVLGIINAFIFVMVYSIIYKGIPYKGVRKGIIYGLLLWLVNSFTIFASMPFYMNISATVVIYWIIQSLVINVIIGAIIGAICKKHE